MNAISLFAGIGGFDKGLEGLPITSLKAYEIDPACCEVYQRITGHSIEQCDLTRHDLAALPNCDLLFGGPPCQDFSSAGANKGESGSRNLWPVAVKAVEVKRPAIFCFENVRGLTQGKHKPYFQAILAELRALGYAVDWRMLNAADYGLPQTRERVFIIGRRDGKPIRFPEPTHWNRPAGLFYQRWQSWGHALQDWLRNAEPYNKPIPNWLLNLYHQTLPETAMFDGHQKGSGKTRQHRPMDEPSFTLVKSNEKSVVRLKVEEVVYRLDIPGMAILQSLPNVQGLTIGMIGNSVAPVQSKAIFSQLVA